MRQQIRHVVNGISPGEVLRQSQAAAQRVVGLDEFVRARTVMIYIAMPQEADTSDIARAAWAAGKTVLTPKVFVHHRYMEALRIHSLTAGLVRSHYGILEPADGPAWPIEQIDLVVVPGMAFDRLGGRLGRGAGYYDRFLCQEGFRAVTCGLALSQQVVDQVPLFDHDRRIDILVTHQEVLRFSAPRQNVEK